MIKILIIGANGFIGSYITAKLLKNNATIICAGRDIGAIQRKFPSVEVIHCDFNNDTDPEIWFKRLHQVDMVINVAGLLTSSGKNKIENVHFYGPKALFEACIKAKIRRIIHISALGIEEEKTTDYAVTKKLADDYLKTLKNIDWVILQPSLIYASGCYGGTSLFRGLAALPYFIPLVGEGLQRFQPIYIDDLTDIVWSCTQKAGTIHRVFKIVGPEIVTVKDILIHFRRWLGLPTAKMIKIPLVFIHLCAKFGDIFGINPLNSTSYKMMMQENVASQADKDELIEFFGFAPRNFEQGLAWEPLTVQSLWHARLFFLKPVLKIILGLFWIMTGLITSFLEPEPGLNIIKDLGFSQSLAHVALYLSCFIDIALGLLLIMKPKITIICLLQIIVVCVYTLMLTVLKPNLWLDPLGPLMKNIPIIILTMTLMAIDRDK